MILDTWVIIVEASDELAIAAVTAAELTHGARGSNDTNRARRLAYLERVVGRIPIEDCDLRVARTTPSCWT